MKVEFYKYSAIGNDFIVIDRREDDISLSQEQIEKICHRRFGIGADGLIFIDKSDVADFKMSYFNSDGIEASMCGNGARSLAHFHFADTDKKTLSLEVQGEVFSGGMSEGGEAFITLKAESEIEKINSKLGINVDTYFVNTGVPHAVIAMKGISSVDIDSEAPKIRYHSFFGSEGTNVDFIEQKSEKEIWARIYERGIEGETFSSGTGASACALSALHAFKMSSPILVSMKGGDLEISFSDDFKEITLRGEVNCSFKGELEL